MTPAAYEASGTASIAVIESKRRRSTGRGTRERSYRVSLGPVSRRVDGPCAEASAPSQETRDPATDLDERRDEARTTSRAGRRPRGLASCADCVAIVVSDAAVSLLVRFGHVPRATNDQRVDDTYGGRRQTSPSCGWRPLRRSTVTGRCSRPGDSRAVGESHPLLGRCSRTVVDGRLDVFRITAPSEQ
jgi:hypothetical protein